MNRVTITKLLVTLGLAVLPMTAEATNANGSVDGVYSLNGGSYLATIYTTPGVATQLMVWGGEPYAGFSDPEIDDPVTGRVSAGADLYVFPGGPYVATLYLWIYPNSGYVVSGYAVLLDGSLLHVAGVRLY